MLAEANAGPWLDDLQENAIMIADAGDGIFNGSDYILFMRQDRTDESTIQSIKDSLIKKTFVAKSYYFLNIGGIEKMTHKCAGCFFSQCYNQSVLV